VPLMARIIWRKVEVKLEAEHNQNHRPGDCRASSCRERASTRNSSRRHLPADGRFCAYLAQMVPTHHGAENVLCWHTKENWCTRLMASRTVCLWTLDGAVGRRA